MIRLEAIEDRTPFGIAAEISRHVEAGDLAPGERLPTVREVAARLGVSIGTVSTAWSALSASGVIVSRGRAGSFVRSRPAEWLSPRVQGLNGDTGNIRLDLSGGTPDAAMLPALDAALPHLAARADTGRYSEVPTLPELEELLRRSWPQPDVAALAIVDGAMDGISRTLEQVVRFGDRVVVESPGFPYLFDLVEAVHAVPVPVELDADGIIPESLARALSRGPSALLLQPRAQNPTGVSMTPDRARVLADLIGRSAGRRPVTVIEDDHSALICSAPAVTLGRWLPGSVVHVRSFAKSHGPDLRIAALGGPAELVQRIQARRTLGPAWTSRLLQKILYALLTDPTAIARVQAARLIYRDRTDRLAAALRRAGVDVGHPDGFNLWLPVQDQRAALVRLAASGIAVAPGAPFIAPGAETTPHVRVTAGMVVSNVRLVAEALADAASATMPGG